MPPGGTGAESKVYDKKDPELEVGKCVVLPRNNLVSTTFSGHIPWVAHYLMEHDLWNQLL